MTYPEHEKMSKIKDESQAQGEFIEWLQSKGFVLMYWDTDDDTWQYDHRPIRARLAEYHKIDLDKLEQEKRAMLAEIRGEEK